MQRQYQQNSYPIYIIPTSCAILPTMHNRKLSTYSLNEHSTQHCSLHSLPLKRQSISDSATFSSNKISQHNLKLPTYHKYPALLTVSAYKTDHTCHAQQQLNCIQPQHTHSPRTSTCTTHPAIPSQLLSTTLICTQLTNTQHSWQNGTRCRDDVNVLWCRSYLVLLVFEGSISTCACFHLENFFVTL